VRAACNDLAAVAEGQDVVVVTHVSPVKAAVAWALDVDDRVTWRLFVAPGSVTRISVAGGRTSLHGFNDTSLQVRST
jgi:broad specificity phosphatase PhoE